MRHSSQLRAARPADETCRGREGRRGFPPKFWRLGLRWAKGTSRFSQPAARQPAWRWKQAPARRAAPAGSPGATSTKLRCLKPCLLTDLTQTFALIFHQKQDNYPAGLPPPGSEGRMQAGAVEGAGWGFPAPLLCPVRPTPSSPPTPRRLTSPAATAEPSFPGSSFLPTWVRGGNSGGFAWLGGSWLSPHPRDFCNVLSHV